MRTSHSLIKYIVQRVIFVHFLWLGNLGYW